MDHAGFTELFIPPEAIFFSKFGLEIETKSATHFPGLHAVGNKPQRESCNLFIPPCLWKEPSNRDWAALFSKRGRTKMSPFLISRKERQENQFDQENQ